MSPGTFQSLLQRWHFGISGILNLSQFRQVANQPICNIGGQAKANSSSNPIQSFVYGIIESIAMPLVLKWCYCYNTKETIYGICLKASPGFTAI